MSTALPALLLADATSSSVTAPWWLAVTVAAVPAAFTTCTLVIQLRSNAATERARFAAQADERQHQMRLAAQAQEHDRALAQAAREGEERERAIQERHALQEKWRSERKDAHFALLALFAEAHDALRPVLMMGIADDDEVVRVEQDERCLLQKNDVEGRLAAAVTTVTLIGSERTAVAAGVAQAALLRLDVDIWEAGLEDGRGIERSELSRLERRFTDAVEDYRAAAREDMGTTA
jgi:hypothetical protein